MTDFGLRHRHTARAGEPRYGIRPRGHVIVYHDSKSYIYDMRAPYGRCAKEFKAWVRQAWCGKWSRDVIITGRWPEYHVETIS